MSPVGDRGSAGQSPSAMELLGLAVLLAAAVVVPLVLGLDSATHSGPTSFFIGLFPGVVAAVATVSTRFERYL